MRRRLRQQLPMTVARNGLPRKLFFLSSRPPLVWVEVRIEDAHLRDPVDGEPVAPAAVLRSIRGSARRRGRSSLVRSALTYECSQVTPWSALRSTTSYVALGSRGFGSELEALREARARPGIAAIHPSLSPIRFGEATRPQLRVHRCDCPDWGNGLPNLRAVVPASPSRNASPRPPGPASAPRACAGSPRRGARPCAGRYQSAPQFRRCARSWRTG